MVDIITSNTVLVITSFIGIHALAWFLIAAVEAGINVLLDDSKGN